MLPTTAILSPHFDDAVFSCWHVLSSPGDVQVVNVFAGRPAEGSIGWWDQLSGRNDGAEAVRVRTEEDRRVLAGIGREPLNLGFLDQQYRRGPQPVEPLVEALMGTLPARATLYAPAALSAHGDHTAARAAALALRAHGFSVVLYADLPHALALGWPSWLAGADGGGDPRADERWSRVLATVPGAEAVEPRVLRLDPAARAAKLEAVRAYQSQVLALESKFSGVTRDPETLGLEVEWRLREGD